MERRYNGSAAYDMFLNNTAQPLKQPERLPDAPTVPQRKVRYKLSISPIAVLGALTAVMMLLLVLFSYVGMFETRNDISKLEEQKRMLSEQNEKLQADYESKIDLAVIEQRALALGMHRPTPDQIRYVSIGEGDTTQVFAMDEERDIFELVFDAFRGAFANVTAYFS
ncbi:MAG: hypothetical protein E7467_00575 [Ruminococcaceae bacterium]|nr:hypothetical protein [Oscillospiraceae bacterium]